MSEEETRHVTSDVNTDVTCGPRYHGRSVRSNGPMLLQIDVADKRVVSSWTFFRASRWYRTWKTRRSGDARPRRGWADAPENMEGVVTPASPLGARRLVNSGRRHGRT